MVKTVKERWVCATDSFRVKKKREVRVKAGLREFGLATYNVLAKTKLLRKTFKLIFCRPCLGKNVCDVL